MIVACRIFQSEHKAAIPGINNCPANITKLATIVMENRQPGKHNSIPKNTHSGISIRNFGSCDVTWLSLYLQDQSHHVACKGSGSSPHSLTSGVPQGSILTSPLFFLCSNPKGLALRASSDNPTLMKHYFPYIFHYLFPKTLRRYQTISDSRSII